MVKLTRWFSKNLFFVIPVERQKRRFYANVITTCPKRFFWQEATSLKFQYPNLHVMSNERIILALELFNLTFFFKFSTLQFFL